MRLVCSEEIEDLEDQLPQVTNLIERDSIKKQIEALHEMADEINRRAEFLIGEYDNKTWKNIESKWIKLNVKSVRKA